MITFTQKLRPACLSLAVCLLLPSSARADEEGEPGKVVRLTVNTTESEKYASFHGAVSIRRAGASASDRYYWGGSTCPAQKLSETQVALLSSALTHRNETLVVPVFRTSKGTPETRCLVAFDLIATS